LVEPGFIKTNFGNAMVMAKKTQRPDITILWADAENYG
jgi:hypothetical protein